MSASKLAGKVALVTAGTKGIGYAVARRLGLDGAKVMISSRKDMNVISAVHALRKENIDVSGVACHAGNRSELKSLISQTVDKYGGIDILFSNAGINPHYGDILGCPEDAWDKTFHMNVKAQYMICQEVAPIMEARGGGSIIMNSTAGAFRMVPVIQLYCVSKLALCGLVKGLIFELSPKNIRINAIAPSVIKTDFSESFLVPFSYKISSKQMWMPGDHQPAFEENTSLMQSKFKEYLKTNNNDDIRKWTLSTYTTMGRHGEPDECAKVVSFLASDDASYISGESIIVAGGFDARI
ncbi:hypothetical protein FSP39_009925 [Pinctada imbricata]|uniref:Uncharacterized protein n=1 Tax=Pinctada imbricata TaxID=66713 RepID=A0AA89C575_PINIB|nr:hypothetical protein FSP39_009925 [Pinctada imbricata]